MVYDLDHYLYIKQKDEYFSEFATTGGAARSDKGKDMV
jgi:hypothetical protein